jgi:hypothetical protein
MVLMLRDAAEVLRVGMDIFSISWSRMAYPYSSGSCGCHPLEWCCAASSIYSSSPNPNEVCERSYLSSARLSLPTFQVISLAPNWHATKRIG